MKKIFICGFKLLFFAGLFLVTAAVAYGQTDLKNWNALQLDLAFSKKLNLRLGHLRGYDISNNYSSDFNQTSARIEYDFTKRFSLSGGIVASGAFSAAEGATRFLIRSTYKIPVGDVLNWSNSLQAETHSTRETRYRQRIIYITRLVTKNRLNFLRLSPSVSYSLFYNIGGNKIQYYDKNDDPAVQQSPDGFHRGRLSANLNFKFSNHVSASLYYMMQREFNIFSSEYHKMNIVSPVDGSIIRPFHDYNVVGTTLNLDFNLYKKKKKTKKRTGNSDQ